MSDPAPPDRQPGDDSRLGRLTARAHPPVAPAPAGLVPVSAPGGGLLAMVYAPEPVADGAAYRLVVLLHGAGGSARQGLDLLLPVADAHHLLLVAPQAAASSWDLIAGGFGVDVRRIDGLLAGVFDGYPVRDVTFGGFSDGASYALSLGLANGDLVDGVLAFSPVSPHRRPPTADRGSSSRTGWTTACCRSTCAAAGSSRTCTTSATTSPTRSSPAATRSPPRYGSPPPPGLPPDLDRPGTGQTGGRPRASSTRVRTATSSSGLTPRSRSMAVART